ncbi:hypothetical protein D3C87_1781650 [compost metagenome]
MLFKDHGFHRQNDILYRFAYIEPAVDHARPGIIHLRQIQQVIGQPGHPLRLRLNILQPLRLVADRVVTVRQQYIRVGVDDRQRGLQLMGGIGDELLLLVKGLPDRGNRTAREEPAGEVEDNQH